MLWNNNKITACKCQMNCVRRGVITLCGCAVYSVRSFQSLQKSMQIFCMRKRSRKLSLTLSNRAAARFGSLTAQFWSALLNADAIEIAQKCARLIEIGCLFFSWLGFFLLLIFCLSFSIWIVGFTFFVLYLAMVHRVWYGILN